MPRLAPLPLSPELSDLAQHYSKTLGFTPNGLLVMQRRPKLARALLRLADVVLDPRGEIDPGFKRLVAHIASREHGCRY